MKRPKITLITEGTTDVFVFQKKVSDKGPGEKDTDPFYNPSMEQNRDLSIVVNQWLLHSSQKHLHFLDGLAASGIRGIRFAHELEGDFEVTINDYNQQAFCLMKKNVSYHTFPNVTVSNKSLNVLLSEQKYDYIDIDPFGSPVSFVDSAMRSIRNNGVIACTATDTACLCGVYPSVCLRRYGAWPFHSFVMHEIGLRILLGFLSREAAKYDKGIMPILSYSSDHFFRIYVKIRKGKRFADESMQRCCMMPPQHILFPLCNNKASVGPLWMHHLHDLVALKQIRTILFTKELNTKHHIWKLLSLFEEEAEAPPFFYTTDDVASFLKTSPPKIEDIFQHLKQQGFLVTPSQFGSTSFKTNASFEDVKEAFKYEMR